MTDILRNALSAHMPSGTRPARGTRGTKYTLNCFACQHRGHNPDKGRRGGVFFNQDGSEGYNCFNCKLSTTQYPGRLLTRHFRDLLSYMGMSSQDVQKLGYDMWSINHALQQGITPQVQIVQVSPPSGAKPLGEWIENPIADENLLAVLTDLDDMSPAIRDSYLWTPDTGSSGDMNRRYIWLIGPPNDPLGWLAKSIDEPDAEWLASDSTIWLYNDEL